MARKRFTERQVIETLINQGLEITCFRCCMPFENVSEIEREHLIELGLGGDDAPNNCCYSHTACHSVITNGTKATTAGSSKQRIAKVVRLRGETKTGPKAKIANRGFNKKLTRKFSGQVIPRTT
jgi:hypothetical protein